MRSVIFDLDGTLADTSADLIAAANSCFTGLGYAEVLDPVADAATAVQGVREMLRLGFSRVRPGIGERIVEENYAGVLQAYSANIDRYTRLYDGAVGALDGLKGAGYVLGVCTNKPQGLAESLLQRLGIRDYFSALVGGDTLKVAKPNAAPLVETIRIAKGDIARAVLVGDTVTDRKTAAAANMPSVLVTFGPGGRNVEKLQPEALLEHFDDLKHVVRHLIG